jgi:2-polyprenyl-3-methyl-5-hydroxy-6-metoxy-1,4-benzoquinol methylase
MDESAYRRWLEIDQRHFWRVGKRRLALAWAKRYLRNQGITEVRCLDIGSACSLFAQELQTLGSVVTIDPHRESVEMSRRVINIDARVGSLPDDLPVEGRFQLISMLDVLEHMNDELEALAAVRDLLDDTGVLLMTVPAYQWLWSHHDVAAHHCRRYTRSRLIKVLREGGFRVLRSSYYTSLLFPIAAVVRLLERLPSSRDPHEYRVKVPRAPINQLFSAMMTSERWLLRFTNLPFGLSIMAICRPTIHSDQR